MRAYSRVTPEGTKDILFEECRARGEVEKRLAEMFSLHGYNEVVTPGIEYYDVFCLPGAAIPQQEMYKTTDNNGRLVVYRPDSTLPIARMAAARLQNIERPIRLYYNQSIYRNRPDLSGRNNESPQMGIELLGVGGIRADLEVIATAVEALSCCTEEFRLEIGNAHLFQSLSGRLAVSEAEKEEIRATIERKNYAALDGLLNRLEQTEAVRAVRSLPRLFGGEEALKEAEQYCRDKEAVDMLNYMKTLYHALQRLGLGDRIIVDLGLVQRNDYYTGVVFSAFVEEMGNAVLIGGRYDNLLEKFGCAMPAVGFSADTDALASILLKREGSRVRRKAGVLVHAEAGFEIDAQVLVNDLVRNGEPCESSVFENLEASKDYARRMGFEKLIAVGTETEEMILSGGGG